MVLGKDSGCMLKVKERLLEILRIKITDKSNKDIIKEKRGLEKNTWSGHI